MPGRSFDHIEINVPARRNSLATITGDFPPDRFGAMMLDVSAHLGWARYLK
jgi:hypothetical protein